MDRPVLMGGRRQAPVAAAGLSSAIVWVSAAYLATAALGTWLAVRDGLVGRPFGWTIDMTPLSGFLYGLGTALSAPLVLLLTLVAANLLLIQGGRAAHGAAGVIAILGAGFLAGMLAEPIFWEVFEPGLGPLQAVIVDANVLLPLSMVILAARAWRQTQLIGSDQKPRRGMRSVERGTRVTSR